MAIMISSNLRINNHQRTLRKQLFFHLNIHGSITYLSLNIELPDTEGNRVTENGRNFQFYRFRPFSSELRATPPVFSTEDILLPVTQ